MIKIIFFGDISGEPGRVVIKKALPEILSLEKPDLVLANVDNLAHGKGVTVKTLEEMIRAGIQGFTSGNHAFSKKEFAAEVFEKYKNIIVRAANIPDTNPGSTAIVLPTPKGEVLIGHFFGQVFMEKQFHDPITSPFAKVEEWMKEYQPKKYAATIIDLHAEVTSEKVAFGHFLDGKVSAVLGTHTHIPTADAKVLPGGTAYITDVGMCGAADSVLGVKKELSLERFTTGNWVPFDIPEDASEGELSYVMINVDDTTGKALDISSKHQIIKLSAKGGSASGGK
ncbi:MAG TPA: TIGR00282 family metallophosphoesterase [Methylomirabilota bacterium]|nr:TIGR00282 family metallophosphoesterase [Methylomirabilota bacterium]